MKYWKEALVLHAIITGFFIFRYFQAGYPDVGHLLFFILNTIGLYGFAYKKAIISHKFWRYYYYVLLTFTVIYFFMVLWLLGNYASAPGKASTRISFFAITITQICMYGVSLRAIYLYAIKNHRI